MLWFYQFNGDRSKRDTFPGKWICHINFHHKFIRQITYFSDNIFQI